MVSAAYKSCYKSFLFTLDVDRNLWDVLEVDASCVFLFFALILQPTSATKHSILQSLGLISSLFSTLDLNADPEGPDGVKGRRFAAHSNPVEFINSIGPLVTFCALTRPRG